MEVECGCGSVRVCGECACMCIWCVSGSVSVGGVRGVAIGKDGPAQYMHIPVGMENCGGTEGGWTRGWELGVWGRRRRMGQIIGICYVHYHIHSEFHWGTSII